MTTATASIAGLTGQYALDPSHTRIGFVARHAMVTKVRGAFNDFEGSGYLDGDNPANSKVSVRIQAKSIDTRNEQRDGHLRSNEFFDMENYPEITFASTEAKQLDDTGFQLTGDLTIKGVTKPVTVDFTFEGATIDPWGNQRIGFDGSTTINRKDWGVTWNAPLEAGGVLVSEKVTLEFEISAVKQA